MSPWSDGGNKRTLSPLFKSFFGGFVEFNRPRWRRKSSFFAGASEGQKRESRGASGGSPVGRWWVESPPPPFCGASTVVQPLVWRCRWAGVLPSARAHTCCSSTGCVVVLPAAAGVRHCLWVLLGGSSSKGSPRGGEAGVWGGVGGGGGRISPTRCVSSICHPS